VSQSCISCVARRRWLLVGLVTLSLLPLTACGGAPTAGVAAAASTSSAAVSDSGGVDATPPAGSTAHVVAQVTAARAMLDRLVVGGRGPKTGYDRIAVFGEPWADVDGNGCGTRDDILGRDLTAVTRRDDCHVLTGRLDDPYTGRSLSMGTDRAAVQIDHVVALSLAWQLGAAQWTQGQRVRFANDPLNLIAVDGAANRQKSDSGPDSWLPSNKPYRCTYVIRFTRVAAQYRLRVTPSMRATISAQLDGCAIVYGEPADAAPLPPAAQEVQTSGTDAETTSPAAQPYYANCAAVRAAGRGPLRRGEPGYRVGLDRDDDGIACDS
jgi:hypothetical protein